MQDAGVLKQQGQGGRLRPRFSRLLHHRQAAWWFGLLGLAGVAQFISFFVTAITVYVSLKTLGHDVERLAPTPILVSFALSVVVALAVFLYLRQTLKDTFFDPPKDRVPRKQWNLFANRSGAAVALMVAYTTLVMWVLLLAGLVGLARLVNPIFGLPGNPLVWFGPVPAAMAVWAFVAWRRVSLEVLETAEPPELRLAASLKQHAQAFQERAEALEAAFEEADAISRKVQRGIELEQEQLRRIREQYRLHAQLMELSDHAPTLRIANTQDRRWGLLVNVVVAAFSIVIGLLLDALVDPDALGQQLRQWFHLG
jgi:hypothetical protein